MLILTNKIDRRCGKRIYYKVICDVCGTELSMDRHHYSTLANKEECGMACSLKIGKIISDSYGSDVLKCFRMRYNAMKQRCLDRNSENYKYYGQRNIKIMYKSFADFYNLEFENFIKAYDKYGSNASPDRINVDGNYEHSNLRWIEFKEQALNKQSTKVCIGISPDGKEYEFTNAQDFAIEHNLTRQSIGKCLLGKMKTHKNWKFYYK